MNTDKIRVAVTGSGGGVGQSIVKALHNTEYEVIALDGEALGTGLYAASTSYLIPYASDPNLVHRLLEICQREKCQFLFPGMDAELMILSKNRDLFKKAGIEVVVSSPDVIEISDNKMLTFTELSKHGILVPQTLDMSQPTEDQQALSYPYILKQRVGGARSKDVYIINNQEKLDGLIAAGLELKNFISQEYIEGDEYTCGTVNLDGQCMGVIVMRRVLRDGDTYKCFSVKNDVIEQQVRKLMAVLKPLGACNVQLRMKDGQPYIFEINARCSGTTAARALCGFNEPRMILDYLSSNKTPQYSITEMTVLRYWKELAVPNELVKKIEAEGMLNTENYLPL